MAATRARQLRRSEPGPRSAREAPSVVVPRQSGWEFPLSREEKKQRVMYLFEAELAEAEHNNRENLEELQSLLEKRKSAPSSPHKTPRAPAHAPSTASTIDTASMQGPSQMRFQSFGLGLLGGLGVLVLAWLCRSPECAVESNANSTAMDLWIRSSTEAPPNVTDRVIGMRNEGHYRLRISNCAEAEWWFSSALHLSSAGGNFSEQFRNHIIGEQGFALVCSQQFKEGAKLLEQHLGRLGFKGQTHLLNAVGYAHFNLQDFRKAGEFFELAINADNFNPVVWNNFAAAKMMSGELQAADNAMNQAAQTLNTFNMLQDYQQLQHYKQMLEFNLHVLVELSQPQQGTQQHMPWIDIWNGY